MIFTQAGLKMKQTSANISLLLSITKYPKSGHVADESHYSYTGYAVAQ